MATQYYCKNQHRRELVLGPQNVNGINGIDYLEVLDTEAPNDELRQRILLVHCLKVVPDSLGKNNVLIEGGVRVRNIRVLWAHQATDSAIPEEKNFFNNNYSDNVLVVRTDDRGDFSTYHLRLVTSAANLIPPDDFDPQLSQVAFSFKAECHNEFDCTQELVCPPERDASPPPIDYLSRDYASFRRLMLDRLSVVMPEWRERNIADMGIAAVETLAYAADYLSYYQDAVATEAYLGTAHERVSMRRHARLLDYYMHEGCNARAWVCIELEKNSEADGCHLLQGTQLVTKSSAQPVAVRSDQFDAAINAGALVFETMHDVTPYAVHNRLRFYTWADEECCLPRGATHATLQDDFNEPRLLRAGDVLVFEEVLGPVNGRPEDADPAHRHAVRLSRVDPEADINGLENRRRPKDEQGNEVFKIDPLTGKAIVEIEWHEQDALPFPLCVSTVIDGEVFGDVSVARGNVVLVDHGYKLEEEIALPLGCRFRPQLKETGITHRVLLDKHEALTRRASEATQQDPRAAAPDMLLQEEEDSGGEFWEARRDLLNSDRFAREFVVEIEENRRATLRFGDGVHGKRPASGTRFHVTYRVGNGRVGNVGAGTIAHVVTDAQGIGGIRNPMPAQGGIDPEPMERVRLHAPHAFRIQERAVTDADYAEVAERHPEVQKAAATQCWTGSWYTVFVTVDRKGGRLVDQEFEKELRGFLERFRLAGHDLEIEPPVFVPLEIVMTVCVASGYYPSTVKEALLETFSNQDLPDGRRGFFHPDRFTFGQPVYLSHIVATAMEVPGVQWVDLTTFKRWGRASLKELEEGKIPMARLEIARLDNDPNLPENGKIEFTMEGGL